MKNAKQSPKSSPRSKNRPTDTRTGAQNAPAAHARAVQGLPAGRQKGKIRALANAAGLTGPLVPGRSSAPAVGAPVDNAAISQHISPTTLAWVKRSRYNPIRQLTPDYLSRIIDIFQNGYLREFALMGDAIKRRDDKVSIGTRKREKSVARHGIEVILMDGIADNQKAQAEKHRDAIKYFFENLTVSHVLEQDVRGGKRLLVEQMMESIYYRYAVHEMVWQPRVDPVTNQPRLTAQFNYVPLWFFEATSAKLRFISHYFGTVMGDDMPDDEWLVTVGEGIMEPLAVAYMFKTLSLKDWVAFNEKFGMPGILGKTSAAKDSPAWNALVDAIEDFGQEWAAVVNTEATIELVEAKNASGQTPFEPLVAAMDKAIATICRGADLSTISSGAGSQGRGGSLQGDESTLLEQDDAEMISETLKKICRIIVRELFGDADPLALAKVVVQQEKPADDTIKRLQYLTGAGVKVAASYAQRELGVPPAAPGEPTLEAPAAPVAEPLASEAVDAKALANFRRARWSATALANASLQHVDAMRQDGRAALFRAHALAQMTAAEAEALRPLSSRIAEIESIDDDAAMTAALKKLQADLPDLFKPIATNPKLIAAFEAFLGTSVVNGAVQAAQRQKKPAA